MNNIWDKLKWRIQSVSNNHQGGGCNGIALIFINVFLSEGIPIAWYKPQRISLEPKVFDCSLLPMEREIMSWDDAVKSLVPSNKVGETTTVDRVLVVSEGQPIGWLRSE